MAEGSLKTLARKAAGPLALLLIVIGFFWKLLLTDQYSWLEAPDLAFQVLPWLNYEAQQFHLHRFPIWDPMMYGGQSLIGQAQPGLAYPLNWLLFYVPLARGHLSLTALTWYFALLHYFAALFCYLLCRDLGRTVIASVLAGVAFGLSGYVGTTDWPQMLNGAIWAPLVFLFLFRAARGLRPVANAAFAGLFLGMSWLSGHHQIPIFLTLACGGTWLYFLFSEGRIRKQLVMPAVVFVMFFICTGALQMWPAYSYGQTAVRWVGAREALHWDEPVPYLVHQQYSLGAVYLLGLVVPGFQSNVSAFVGVVGLSLAGLTFLYWRGRKEIVVLYGVGFAGLLLALGKNDVFHGVLYSVAPMFEKARSPGTAIFLFHFAIAVLVAFGFDALAQPAVKPFLRRRLVPILAGFGALTFLILFAADLGLALSWPSDDRVMMSAVAAFAFAGLVYRSSRAATPHAGLQVLMIALYLVEIGNVSLFALPHKEEKDRNVFMNHFADTRPVADYLRRQPSPLRVQVNDADVPINFGDWYGIDTQMGYLASLSVNVSQLEMHTERAKALYGVLYEVSKRPTMEGQTEVFRDGHGLAVYKNPTALPRVWTVHEVVQVKDAKDARLHLQDTGFDLAKKAFGYEKPPRMDTCDGDVVRSFNRGISSTVAVVDMKCRGMVVESENDAPGWIAIVDGKRTPIYEAYTTLRGVVVDAGRHRIEMRYRPASVIFGAVATILSFIGALVLCFVKRF